MKPSDSPYAVGTPEHSNWVKNVLLPAQGIDAEFQEAEDARAGASTIGGELIIGNEDPLVIWLQEHFKEMIERTTTELITIMKSFQTSVDAVTKEFENIAGVIDVYTETKDHKQHQKHIKQLCIPHNQPKSSCRKCARGRK